MAISIANVKHTIQSKKCIIYDVVNLTTIMIIIIIIIYYD